MNRSGLSRLFPIILVIIIVIVAVAALVSVGRMLFSGDNGTPAPIVEANNGKDALTKTTADRSVRMVVRGPITANETFRSHTITISPNKRVMTTYKGYVGEQIENQELDNNVQAYKEFVSALSRANLMEGKPLSGEENDTSGICASGTLYEFEVRQNDKPVQKLWTTSCKGSQGSLKANLSQVSRLFRVQIPEYSKILSNARISS